MLVFRERTHMLARLASDHKEDRIISASESPGPFLFGRRTQECRIAKGGARKQSVSVISFGKCRPQPKPYRYVVPAAYNRMIDTKIYTYRYVCSSKIFTRGCKPYRFTRGSVSPSTWSGLRVLELGMSSRLSLTSSVSAMSPFDLAS